MSPAAASSFPDRDPHQNRTPPAAAGSTPGESAGRSGRMPADKLDVFIEAQLGRALPGVTVRKIHIKEEAAEVSIVVNAPENTRPADLLAFQDSLVVQTGWAIGLEQHAETQLAVVVSTSSQQPAFLAPAEQKPFNERFGAAVLTGSHAGLASLMLEHEELLRAFSTHVMYRNKVDPIAAVQEDLLNLQVGDQPRTESSARQLGFVFSALAGGIRTQAQSWAITLGSLVLDASRRFPSSESLQQAASQFFDFADAELSHAFVSIHAEDRLSAQEAVEQLTAKFSLCASEYAACNDQGDDGFAIAAVILKQTLILQQFTAVMQKPTGADVRGDIIKGVGVALYQEFVSERERRSLIPLLATCQSDAQKFFLATAEYVCACWIRGTKRDEMTRQCEETLLRAACLIAPEKSFALLQSKRRGQDAFLDAMLLSAMRFGVGDNETRADVVINGALTLVQHEQFEIMNRVQEILVHGASRLIDRLCANDAAEFRGLQPAVQQKLMDEVLLPLLRLQPGMGFRLAPLVEVRLAASESAMPVGAGALGSALSTETRAALCRSVFASLENADDHAVEAAGQDLGQLGLVAIREGHEFAQHVVVASPGHARRVMRAVALVMPQVGRHERGEIREEIWSFIKEGILPRFKLATDEAFKGRQGLRVAEGNLAGLKKQETTLLREIDEFSMKIAKAAADPGCKHDLTEVRKLKKKLSEAILEAPKKLYAKQLDDFVRDRASHTYTSLGTSTFKDVLGWHNRLTTLKREHFELRAKIEEITPRERQVDADQERPDAGVLAHKTNAAHARNAMVMDEGDLLQAFVISKAIPSAHVKEFFALVAPMRGIEPALVRLSLLFAHTGNRQLHEGNLIGEIHDIEASAGHAPHLTHCMRKIAQWMESGFFQYDAEKGNPLIGFCMQRLAVVRGSGFKRDEEQTAWTDEAETAALQICRRAFADGKTKEYAAIGDLLEGICRDWLETADFGRGLRVSAAHLCSTIATLTQQLPSPERREDLQRRAVLTCNEKMSRVSDNFIRNSLLPLVKGFENSLTGFERYDRSIVAGGIGEGSLKDLVATVRKKLELRVPERETAGSVRPDWLLPGATAPYGNLLLGGSQVEVLRITTDRTSSQ